MRRREVEIQVRNETPKEIMKHSIAFSSSSSLFCLTKKKCFGTFLARERKASGGGYSHPWSRYYPSSRKALGAGKHLNSEVSLFDLEAAFVGRVAVYRRECK